MMALKLDPVRMLIADDVGIGKTIEACLIARELLDRGEIRRIAVLCPPHLAEQWQRELAEKFHIDAVLVLSSTIQRLERDLPLGVSVFDRHPFTVVSTDFIKAPGRGLRPPVPRGSSSWTKRTPVPSPAASAAAASSATSSCAASPPTPPATWCWSPPRRTAATRKRSDRSSPCSTTISPTCRWRSSTGPNATASAAGSPATSCSAAGPTSAAISRPTPRFPSAEGSCVLLPRAPKEVAYSFSLGYRALFDDILGRFVLVCTDCLSEGINLQEHFDAVLHYDLAWNPTRHEQREGRVDRFGQEKPEVRVVTWYGADNPIDGVILDVLIRKHKSIRSALGVTVAVPGSSQQIAEALFEGALFRERAGGNVRQLALDFIDEFDVEMQAIHAEWENARDREKASRSRFAQHTLDPGAVAAEIDHVRTAIGRSEDVDRFLTTVLQAANVPVRRTGRAVTVNLGTQTPRALRQAIGCDEPFTGRFDLPLPDGETYLGRTSPIVEGLASWTLDQALDPESRDTPPVASRCGVIATSAVAERTTLLVARFRYHLRTGGAGFGGGSRSDTGAGSGSGAGSDPGAARSGSGSGAGSRSRPGADSGRDTLLCEEIVPLACTGAAEAPRWLAPEEGERLLTARPERNLLPTALEQQLDLTLPRLAKLRAALEPVARERAEAQREAHERVRVATRAKGSVTVEPVLPVDLLGIYVLVPLPPSVGEAT